MGSLTVGDIRQVQTGGVWSAARSLRNEAHQLAMLKTQFTAKTDLNHAWNSPSATRASQKAHVLSMSIGVMVDSLATMAGALETFAKQLDAAQDLIGRAQAVITALNYPVSMGDTGSIPPIMSSQRGVTADGTPTVEIDGTRVFAVDGDNEQLQQISKSVYRAYIDINLLDKQTAGTVAACAAAFAQVSLDPTSFERARYNQSSAIMKFGRHFLRSADQGPGIGIDPTDQQIRNWINLTAGGWKNPTAA